MGLLESSTNGRWLLVQGTQLARASWAATTSCFSPINRGREGRVNGFSLSGIEESLKITEKNCFRGKNPSRGAFIMLPRRFRKRFRGDSSLFFIVLHRSSSFFSIQPVSSRNKIFQLILCTLSGPYLFCVLVLSFHLLSVPLFSLF